MDYYYDDDDEEEEDRIRREVKEEEKEEREKEEEEEGKVVGRGRSDGWMENDTLPSHSFLSIPPFFPPSLQVCGWGGSFLSTHPPHLHSPRQDKAALFPLSMAEEKLNVWVIFFSIIFWLFF